MNTEENKKKCFVYLARSFELLNNNECICLPKMGKVGWLSSYVLLTSAYQTSEPN